jgi:hypothetical protein
MMKSISTWCVLLSVVLVGFVSADVRSISDLVKRGIDVSDHSHSFDPAAPVRDFPRLDVKAADGVRIVAVGDSITG